MSLYNIVEKYVFPSDPEKGKLGSIDFNIALIKGTGVPFLGTTEESKTYKIGLVAYAFVVISIITCCFFMLEMFNLVDVWGNLNQVTQNVCLTLMHFAAILKIINTFYRRKDIIRVIEQFRSMSRKFVVSDKQKSKFYRGEFESKIALILYFSLVFVTAILCITVLIIDAENMAKKKFPYMVDMPEFLPFDLQLAYMGIASSWIAFQVVPIDYLNIVLMNQARFQMKVINISFESLSSADPRITDANGIINSVVEHHNWILKLRNDIESIFKYPVLLQFCASLSIFALSGFQATVQSDSSSIMMVYFYCGCMFCQLFVYCWFGNEVSEQSKTLAFEGYSSPWYYFDQKFQKTLIIFLINAQQPFIFTAGGFANLSLVTFSGILSRSYTYIAVLRQIYSEK